MSTGRQGVPAPDGGVWPRRIESQGEFVLALHEAVTLALQHPARRMVWVDPDFEGWTLDDAALWPRLVDWLRLPQRRLVLLARDYEGLSRRCPRFVAGYRLWSHAITAFSPARDDEAALPSVLLVEVAGVVQVWDKERWRGRASADLSELRHWVDRLDAVLQRSSPALPCWP